MQAPQAQARQQEAEARQLRAEVQQGAALQVYGGPDRRELSLGQLIEAGLRAHDTLDQVEGQHLRALATGSTDFQTETQACLRRARGLHLEFARRLVNQLDQAWRDGLSVRNAQAFRRHYAALIQLEAMDHGQVPPHIQDLAEAAAEARGTGQTQSIEAEQDAARVRSARTWEFMKQTAALDEATQDLTARLYRRFFQTDDRHPLFAGRTLLHRLTGETLWLVEISPQLRAVALLDEAPGPGRQYTWFWIGAAAEWFASPGA